MPSISRILMATAMGACVGGGGVVMHSMVQVGRMPPTKQVGGAAAFMGFMLGLGSVVRTK